MKAGGNWPEQVRLTTPTAPERQASATPAFMQAKIMTRVPSASRAASRSVSARIDAMLRSGTSIPGTRSDIRRNGVDVGQAPAQMPQATQYPGSTTASASKVRPSLRGSMVMALYGQSFTQRVQPLQLARSTLAARGRLNGGSHGAAATT